jgi:drug/metabolite transporter (DMT)-like permease
MPKSSPGKPSGLAAPLFMLLSACGFTAMNLLLKLSMADFGVWDVSFYRFFGGLILLVAVFGCRGNPFRSANTKLRLTRGCTGSIAFIFFIFSVRRLPVSMALMLLYAFPAFRLFSSWLYGKGFQAGGCVWQPSLPSPSWWIRRRDGCVRHHRRHSLSGLAGLTVAIIRG